MKPSAPTCSSGAGVESHGMSTGVRGNWTQQFFREAGSSSHAAGEVFQENVTPDPQVKISPMEPSRLLLGDPVPFEDQGRFHACQGVRDLETPDLRETVREKSEAGLFGSTLEGLGLKVQQWLLEVSPLRGKSTGRRSSATLFPLPTSSSVLLSAFPSLGPPGVAWLASICMGLNSLWGEEMLYDGCVSPVAWECLKELASDVHRICQLPGEVETFDWDGFFSTRGIDYKGDEVKTAREFAWSNIAPALPAEIGRVPLEEVCTLGARHYVENLDLYIKSPDRWELVKPPRVMVQDEDWSESAEGLSQRVSVCPCQWKRSSMSASIPCSTGYSE